MLMGQTQRVAELVKRMVQIGCPGPWVVSELHVVETGTVWYKIIRKVRPASPPAVAACCRATFAGNGHRCINARIRDDDTNVSIIEVVSIGPHDGRWARSN